MPASVQHVLSATTPDNPTYEIQPKHWNSAHAVSLNVLASEISPLFSNKNGVSFGLDGTNITGSYTVPLTTQFLTTAMASNRGSDFVQATAAFAGTNASGTINSMGISVAVGNYITTAMASNRGTDFVQATAAFAGTSASGTINSTGISVSIGPYITTARASTDAIGLNTAQTNVTWTANSSGLSLNAGGYAGTGFTTGSTTGLWTATQNTAGLSEVVPYATRYIWPEGNLTAVTAPSNAVVSIQYVVAQMPITGTRLDALASFSAGSAATANTAAWVLSAYGAVYTKNGVSLSSVSSGSTQTTYSYASNTAGQTQLTQSAIRPLSIPINFNMAPGEYYVGFNIVTTVSSIGTATTNLGATLSMMGGNQIQSGLNYQEITAATNASKNLYGGMGIWSVATTGMPASMALSDIRHTGVNLSAANIALVFRNA